MKSSVFGSSKVTIKKLKLAVLTPARDMLHSAYSLSLANLIKHNTQVGLDTFVFMDLSTVLLTQRSRLAAEAIKMGADYMLWLDSDMVFPSTTATKLLAHNEPVVAANYVRRQLPAKGVAYETIGEWNNPLTFEPRDELVPVEGIGMGCMLVKTSILNEIPRPWFQFHYTEESNDHLGEDMDFCQKLKKAGYTVKVDTRLSMEMRHVGSWAFGPELIKSN